MLGQTIPKDDGGREEAVLVSTLLDWYLTKLLGVTSGSSVISEWWIWCYIHKVVLDLVKHGGSCIVSPLL